MKIVVSIFIIILLVLAIPILAQDNETTDPCEGVVCEDSSTVCPDGATVTCSNSCAEGSCTSCTPDCTGHEAPPDPCEGVTCPPSTAVCPDGSEVSCENTCSEGSCSECETDCTGHEAPVCGDGICEAGEENACPEDCIPAPCMVPCPPYSETTCSDGYVATCSNTLDSGACTCHYCEPDCTGHDGTECIGEGGIHDTAGDRQCCTGLKSIRTQVGDGRICSLTAGHVCSPCGNGECEAYESACSCPEDCPCPEGQTYLHNCPDGTEVPWCECKNGQWVCTISPESACPAPVCGDGICEIAEETTCLEDCAPEPCICSFLYNPVCGVDRVTYPNLCQADCADVDVACSGICPCPVAPGPGPRPIVCGDGICDDIERTAEQACYQDCPCQCPVIDDPVCGSDGITHNNICEAVKCADVDVACSGTCPCPAPVCGDGACDYGEECPVDCCPVNDVCPDGVTIPCKLMNGECICDKPCPLPPECREEISPQGFVRIVCDTPPVECPPIPEGWEKKCVEKGGKPVRKTGPPPGHCLFVDCIFGDIPTDPITPIECPLPEEVDERLAKCTEMGQKSIVTYKGGCMIAICMYPGEVVCPPITYGPEEEELKNKCFEQGLEVIEDFDERGCPFLRCGEPGKFREIPIEARERCKEMGGEFIERRDEFGYIVFHKCVVPGDHDIYIEPIKRIPDMTELLEIAFKLENLKIELNELGRKSDDIANYYERTGSPEAERFKRVADMFYSAKTNVDEIKTKLRENLDHITISDLMDIKHDVMYIKDVILKDILYLMLSTGDDVTDITRGDVKDCGRDERCFDMAFRTCKKVTFRPEETGPIAEIKGLEGDKCILYVFVHEDQYPPPGTFPGVYPPYEMTCRIPDYSLGVRDPEESIFPYCEGSFVEVMKQMAEQPGEISGPGGCASEEECKEYCSRPENADECMEFVGEKGFEQKQCSGCLDNGICDPGECQGCPDCPTEEEKDFEKMFRECRPGTVLPPNGGPIAKIHGLEDGLCVIQIFVPEDEPYPSGEVIITPEEWNPPYEMWCRVPDYYMGAEPPEERILPYCEGPLLEIIKKTRGVVQGVTDCGMDGGCFNMAFRECRLAMFNPGGSGSVVKIKGLEGDKCILTQVAGEHEMICKVPNYHLGINPPEENVLPYCEGSLVEIIYEAGPQPV